MTESADPTHTPSQPGTYSALYRIAAYAAFATVAVTVMQIVLGVMWPPPDFAPSAESASRILAMAAANPALTFLQLDGLMVVDYLLLVVVYLAFYAALRRTSPSLVLLGTAFALIAITLYLTVNPAATILVLAAQSAEVGAAESGLIAAAQTALANFQGTAFLVHYVVMGVAGILVGCSMWGSQVFSRRTAIAGIAQGAMMLVPVTFGVVGLLFAIASLIPFTVWFVLVGMRLLKLAGLCESGRVDGLPA